MKPFIKKFRIHYLIIALFFLCFNNSSAQENKSDFWNHVRFGGSVGAAFSNDNFYASLAPSAIYDFNRYFSGGVGLQGSYANTDFYKASTYGGSLLTFLRPFPALRLSAEFELLQVNMKSNYLGSEEEFERNYIYPALFLGAGYRTGPVTIGLRYDVLYDEDKSIYSTPLAPFVSVYF